MQARTLYIPTLDGWRALAILLVVANHAGVHRIGPFSTTWLANHGGYGVDVFFAISGFLICTLLLQEEERSGTIRLRSFYFRRAFRILPAALTYLLTVGALRLGGFLTSLRFSEWLGSIFFFRNLQSMGPDSWYTSHFWSLSVEEHFYFLLPALLVLLAPGRRRPAPSPEARVDHRALILLSAGILILPIGLFLSRRVNPVLFTDYKLGAIFLAASAAVFLRDAHLRAFASRLLYPAVIVPIAFAAMLVIPGGSALLILPFLFLASVTSTVLHPNAAFSRVLETRPLRFLGKRSYSLYLWQQLFLSAHFGPVDMRLQHWPLSLFAAFVAAGLSYALIERPMIRVGHRVAARNSQPATAISDPLPVPTS